MDIASATTQENVACVTSVASVELQNLADQANRRDVSITNQNMNNAAVPYNWNFCNQILRLKILAQDFYSDDDVVLISDSDSDILETIEKADFVELLDDDHSSMLAGFEGDFNK